MGKNLDNDTKQDELKISSMDKREFTDEIKKLFRSVPTSEDVRTLLVPNGVKNSAVTEEGQFKKGQIFKFVFQLKDGCVVTVKAHKQAKRARGKDDCNSKIYPTAQFELFDPNDFKMYQLVKEKNKVKWYLMEDEIYNLKDEERKDELLDNAHFPLFKFNTKM